MTQRLPLFPLGVVLFPGALIPLHIFEPRYRRLLADVLAGDGRFGLLPPGPHGDAPPPGTVGCVAEVRGAQALEDGRSNIVVEGSARFMVQRYLDEATPYLLAMVDPFADRPGSAPAADAVASLTDAFARYRPAFHAVHDRFPDEGPLPDDAEALTFRVAAALDLERAERQRLLEERDTGARLRRLLDLLGPRTADLEAGARTRTRAASNGKGHVTPGLLDG